MKALAIVFFVIPLYLRAQQFTIDFENNSIPISIQQPQGRWSVVETNPLSGIYSLQHTYNNDVDDIDIFSFYHNQLALQGKAAVWEFTIRYNYTPSSANNWQIGISNGLPTESNFAEGLLLGLNADGSDDLLKVWEKSSNGFIMVCSSLFNWQTLNMENKIVRFRLTKNANDDFELMIDTANTGFVNCMAFHYSNLTQLQYFSIYYQYSPSRDQGITFDDLNISGEFNTDNIPPKVASVQVLQPNLLGIDYSEPILHFNANEYCVEGIGCGVANKLLGNYFTVELPFKLHPGYSYVLSLPDVKDMAENIINSEDKAVKVYFPKAFDVIISEIMADPSPSIHLPECEYIELKNRTSFDINLFNWKLKINSQSLYLPSILIPALSELVICDTGFTIEFPIPEKIVSLPNFPAINNTEAELLLFNNLGSIVHTAHYSSHYFLSDNKQNGGWSLEMIATDIPCVNEGNWSESADTIGGTPGWSSNFTELGSEIVATELWRAAIVENDTLKVYFSEGMDSSSVSNPLFYSVSPFMGNPLKVLPSWPIANNVNLIFENFFDPGISYQLSLTDDIVDCGNNSLLSKKINDFGIPALAIEGDIVINEIMYDPLFDRNEYIELYNTSQKIIDLRNWRILVGGNSTDTIIIASENFPVLPQGYVIISSERGRIDSENKYSPQNIVVLMPNMPTLVNSATGIELFNEQKLSIDKIYYSPNYHHKGVQDAKGVALERINSKLPAMDENNWQSSSADKNYQTPGFVNSQDLSENQKNKIWIEPEVISPDDNGVDDQLTLHYQLEHDGFMTRIIVFDALGNEICVIMNGSLLGTKGEIVLNSSNTDINKWVSGIYILYFEAYDSLGKTYKAKRSFVLAIP